MAITAPNAGLPASLAAATGGAASGAEDSSDPTRRAYRADWRYWMAPWCDQHGTPLPARPEAVGGYLADRIGTLSVATLGGACPPLLM